MKKLLELLNEYRTEQEEIELDEFEVSQTLDSLNYLRLFIKWLVKNNKIDFRKADADISKDIVLWREPDFADFMVYRRFLDEEKVLMLLSIQDNPIEFLCSVLK